MAWEDQWSSPPRTIWSGQKPPPLTPWPAHYLLDNILVLCYISAVEWEVEYTDEFEAWWNGLTEDEQISVRASVVLLIEHGPHLGYPHSSQIKGSRHGRMRELRVQHQGRPVRVLYAFDPRRIAILLIGGDKTGNARWYDAFVPKADAIYDAHLEVLRLEGVLRE